MIDGLGLPPPEVRDAVGRVVPPTAAKAQTAPAVSPTKKP